MFAVTPELAPKIQAHDWKRIRRILDNINEQVIRRDSGQEEVYISINEIEIEHERNFIAGLFETAGWRIYFQETPQYGHEMVLHRTHYVNKVIVHWTDRGLEEVDGLLHNTPTGCFLEVLGKKYTLYQYHPYHDKIQVNSILKNPLDNPSHSFNPQYEDTMLQIEMLRRQ
jgi:hypothetical protein